MFTRSALETVTQDRRLSEAWLLPGQTRPAEEKSDGGIHECGIFLYFLGANSTIFEPPRFGSHLETEIFIGGLWSAVKTGYWFLSDSGSVR